ncbi:MAG TPA: prepilin peptidase [Bryobacteraceae bacterium]|nr:prepilin peptidase [Bryobacteraceae bacterium]
MLVAILAGLFGLLIGSFLNACIYRFPRDITIWNPPRSFCPACEATIAWYDNIPVLSYLLLRGQCRQCGFRIPFRYVLVEILCGVMYFLIVLQFGWTLLALKLALFGSINLELIATDFEERILPDEFTKGGVLAGLVLSWFEALPVTFSSLVVPDGSPLALHSLAESALGAGFGYGSLWTIGWLYRRFRGQEGMGMGDFKMAAMIGAFLGMMPMLAALMVGSVIGAVAGMAVILIAKKEAATYEVPFGSYMGMAAMGVAWMEAVRDVADAVVH